MLRTRPAPFTRDQIADFPVIAAMALHEHYPDADHLKWLDAEPDLSGRVRYAYSAFAEPDLSVDYYYLYIELDDARYVVTFDRDGQMARCASRLTGPEPS